MTSNFQPVGSESSSPRSAVSLPSRPSPHCLPYAPNSDRPATPLQYLIPNSSSDSGSFHSPDRHHFRVQSASKPVKETRNARSEYSNSEDDGTSQLRINQYVIQQEIGRGSFGAVHLAIDQFGHEFAVKEFSKSRLRRRAKSNLLRRAHNKMPPPVAPTTQPAPGFRALLDATFHRSSSMSAEETDNSFDLIKEEIAIMKKLNHPNLVQLIEVLDDPEGDSLFMVLEMCKKGVIMKVEVDDTAEPYPEESCRMWFRDLLLAIEYLHAQGVIHRDIKPDNCLLTDDDTLKVVDFGVSEMFEKASEMRIAKSAGSPAFMAPELCVIAHGDVKGKATDIWSMGVTLYCLRFGRVPFEKEAVLDLYNTIVNDPVSLPDDCDPVFADVMRRLLEKDPDKRIEMVELREHPWVTLNGADPLLSAEDNCRAMVSPPTEDEKNAAITSNMARIMAIMKAVNRFKTLLDKKRPDLVNSILGHASKYVKPPSAMSKEEMETAAALHDPSSEAKDKDVDAARRRFLAEGDTLGAELAAKIDRLPRYLKNALFAESRHSSDPISKTDSDFASPPLPPRPNLASSATMPMPPLEHSHSDPSANATEPLPRHTISYPGKGQAHDPLEDHLFLFIGQGPSAGGNEASNLSDTNEDGGPPIVCESPPATDFNVYERAYEEQVDSIRRERGRQSQIYLTRRVEAKMRDRLERWSESAESHEPGSKRGMAKHGFVSVVGRAMDKANEYAAELEKKNEAGRMARQSPGLR